MHAGFRYDDVIKIAPSNSETETSCDGPNRYYCPTYTLESNYILFLVQNAKNAGMNRSSALGNPE